MSGSARVAAAARTGLRLGAALLVAWASLRALDWLRLAADAMPETQGLLLYYGILGLALLVYAALLAIPFVPGIEVGIMILAMQGPGAALPVYLATLAGLALAYGVGARLPARWLSGAMADLGLARAAALLERVEPLPREARLELMRERLPRRLGPALLGWRYLILAAVLNLPGNWLLGGGGGIMLVAGLSGLFRGWAVLATVAIAVAPVPLLVWGFGIDLI